MGPRTLESAKQAAAQILNNSGVFPLWEAGSEESAEAHISEAGAYPAGPARAEPHLVIRVVAKAPVKVLPGTLGIALPDSYFGVHATVFWNRIDSIGGRYDVARVLGSAMAHEIGHILLGSNEHSAFGIMKAPWRSWDLDRASRGLLAFTSEQGEVIRAAVIRRTSSISDVQPEH